jgi:hypothetical protein
MQKKWLAGFPDRESQKKTRENYETIHPVFLRFYDDRFREQLFAEDQTGR